MVNNTFQNFTELHSKRWDAIFEVSYLNKRQKPHKSGKHLLFWVHWKTTEIIHERQCNSKIKSIPLSANTARILGKHCWKVENTVLQKYAVWGNCPQLGGNTDVANASSFSTLEYCRLSFNNETHWKATFCEPIEGKNDRKDIASTLNYFLNKQQCFAGKMCKQPWKAQLLWLDQRGQIPESVCEPAASATFLHCIIHKHEHPAKAYNVLQSVVDAANLIQMAPRKFSSVPKCCRCHSLFPVTVQLFYRLLMTSGTKLTSIPSAVFRIFYRSESGAPGLPGTVRSPAPPRRVSESALAHIPLREALLPKIISPCLPACFIVRTRHTPGS